MAPVMALALSLGVLGTGIDVDTRTEPIPHHHHRPGCYPLSRVSEAWMWPCVECSDLPAWQGAGL